MDLSDIKEIKWPWPKREEEECTCEDYEIGTNQISNAQHLSEVHHGARYTGKVFKYCPWCGKKVNKKYFTNKG